MGEPLSPIPPPAPPPRPRDARFIEWAQRINGEYASIVRWAGLVGFIVFASQNRLEVASAFGGLIPLSFAIGKTDK